jgi:hypothetical protein
MCVMFNYLPFEYRNDLRLNNYWSVCSWCMAYQKRLLELCITRFIFSLKNTVYAPLYWESVYNTITLQKNLSDLSISWVFHVLLYCRIYASAFSLIALKIKLTFSMGLHLSISHYLKCPAGGISPIRTVLVFLPRSFTY